MGYPFRLLALQWKRVLAEHGHSLCSPAGWFGAVRLAAMLSLISHMCCKSTYMNGARPLAAKDIEPVDFLPCWSCVLEGIGEGVHVSTLTKVHARQDGCFLIRNLCSVRVLNSNGLFGSNPMEKLPRLATNYWNCPPGSYYYLCEML